MSNAYRFGYRIVGSCAGERRLVDWQAAFTAYAECDDRAHVDREAYLSAFTFGADFAGHLLRTGTTKGYNGCCCSPWLWWDIDRADDLEAARRDAAALCVALCERFAIAEDDVLAFYSGSKGFHVGLPTALWQPEPGPTFNRTARRFAERVAEVVGIVIDAGVYDTVRAFRAPNSRHPATGLHKRRLAVGELMHLSAAAIREVARTPAPFDIPDGGGGCGFELAAAWRDAGELVRREADAMTERRAATNGTPTLNRATLAFIRDGASPGGHGTDADKANGNGRHRLLYSAARNLGDFGCPPALAHALLTEAALDSGLSPSDVRRQIECGLIDAAKAVRHE